LLNHPSQSWFCVSNESWKDAGPDPACHRISQDAAIVTDERSLDGHLTALAARSDGAHAHVARVRGGEVQRLRARTHSSFKKCFKKCQTLFTRQEQA
jgi:hypothetical protein